MVSFRRDDMRFTLRVAAVVLREGLVLAHRFENEDFWCLPGGRVHLQETAEQAVIREMHEEINATVTVDRLLWVAENFFDADTHHEVGFYFLVRLPVDRTDLLEDSFVGKEGSAPLYFRWFPVDSLEDLNLLPVFLRTALAAPPTTTSHVVNRDSR